MRIHSTSGGTQGPGNINQLIGSSSGAATPRQAPAPDISEPASQEAATDYNIGPLADENAAYQSAGLAAAAILAQPEAALASQAALVSQSSALTSQYLQALLE